MGKAKFLHASAPPGCNERGIRWNGLGQYHGSPGEGQSTGHRSIPKSIDWITFVNEGDSRVAIDSCALVPHRDGAHARGDTTVGSRFPLLVVLCGMSRDISAPRPDVATPENAVDGCRTHPPPARAVFPGRRRPRPPEGCRSAPAPALHTLALTFAATRNRAPVRVG